MTPYCPIHKTLCTINCIFKTDEYNGCLMAQALRKYVEPKEEKEEIEQLIDINKIQRIIENYPLTILEGSCYTPEIEYYNIQGGR